MPTKPSPTAVAETPAYEHRVIDNALIADIQDHIFKVRTAILSYNDQYGKKSEQPEGTLNNSQALALAKEEFKEETSDLLDQWDRAWEVVANLRRSIGEKVSKLSGKPLHWEAPKPDESETAALKLQRKTAVGRMKLLKDMIEAVSSKDGKKAIESFLAANPMPSVGTDTVVDVTSTAPVTKKYRVDVDAVAADGTQLLNGDARKGFTSAVNAIRKSKVYGRGDAPDQDAFRARWEAREEGSKSTTWLDETVGITYTITDRG